jgi:hypothetical protein
MRSQYEQGPQTFSLGDTTETVDEGAKGDGDDEVGLLGFIFIRELQIFRRSGVFNF